MTCNPKTTSRKGVVVSSDFLDIYGPFLVLGPQTITND